MTQQSSGDWTIRWLDATGRHEEEFSAVAICSGLHQHPHVARFPGQETFPGDVIHGAQYRRPAQVAGKRVLVVGAGESGADVVAEVAAHAAETVLSLRRGVAVQPRIRLGKPGDYLTSRLANSAADWVGETRDPVDDWKRTLYRVVFLPVAVVDKCLQFLFRLGWELLPLFASRRAADVASTQDLKLVKWRWRIPAACSWSSTGPRPTSSCARSPGPMHLAPAIDRPGPRDLAGTSRQVEFDLVILCTGFDTRMPILDDEVAAAPRYLHTFNPRVGASLAFIGFLRPAFGAIPPLAELQARWFALLQSGRLQLPADEQMRGSITRWTRFHAHMFRPLKGRLEHLVDHTSFCDELATQVGCKPSRAALRRESLRFRLRFFAGPFVPAQYRLVGPHARPVIARDVIASLPIVHPVPRLITHYLRWRMSRVLHRLLGAEFSPKLAID